MLLTRCRSSSWHRVRNVPGALSIADMLMIMYSYPFDNNARGMWRATHRARSAVRGPHVTYGRANPTRSP